MSSGSTAADCYAALNGSPTPSAPPCSTSYSPLTPVRTSPRPGSPKSLLRHLLSCTQRGGLRHEIHTALDRFYQFCAACKVPEVIRFARTIETWQAPIIAALQTGLTNARTEGDNRIVKHIGRIAFDFRNPDNQRRHVKWACTRRSRRFTPSRHQCHCLSAKSPHLDAASDHRDHDVDRQRGIKYIFLPET